MKKVLAILAAAVLALSACGNDDTPGKEGTPGGGTSVSGQPTDAGSENGSENGGDKGSDEKITATVFAAASLHAAFEEITEGSDINYSFDGSSGLVDQIAGGAPADVFASADKRNMDKAVDQDLIDGEPVMFAKNHLVLVTPAGNPAGVKGLDESLDGAKLVVCAPEVPCGGATGRLAEKLGVELKPVSEETAVTDVLGKVTAGEADAGLVYLTDATGAGDKVEMIEIPEAAADPNTYWIAKVKGGNTEQAQAYIDLIMGEGQKTLAKYGFVPGE